MRRKSLLTVLIVAAAVLMLGGFRRAGAGHLHPRHLQGLPAPVLAGGEARR